MINKFKDFHLLLIILWFEIYLIILDFLFKILSFSLQIIQLLNLTK